MRDAKEAKTTKPRVRQPVFPVEEIAAIHAARGKMPAAHFLLFALERLAERLEAGERPVRLPRIDQGVSECRQLECRLPDDLRRRLVPFMRQEGGGGDRRKRGAVGDSEGFRSLSELTRVAARSLCAAVEAGEVEVPQPWWADAGDKLLDLWRAGLSLRAIAEALKEEGVRVPQECKMAILRQVKDRAGEEWAKVRAEREEAKTRKMLPRARALAKKRGALG